MPSTLPGQLVASYEYDAFGREVRAWGLNTPATNQPPGLPASRPWADLLPFHYSSKLRDVDSGFNYYGYRFYDPGAGRWLNRDPIGVEGGVNLYAICNNSVTNSLDFLGFDMLETDGTSITGEPTADDIKRLMALLVKINNHTCKNGKRCFRVSLHRKAQAGDLFKAIRRCDKVIFFGHGSRNARVAGPGTGDDAKGDSEEERHLFMFKDNNVSLEPAWGRTDNLFDPMKKFKAFACYHEPNKNGTSGVNQTFTAFTNYLKSILKDAPQDCEKELHVCILIGRSANNREGHKDWMDHFDTPSELSADPRTGRYPYQDPSLESGKQ